jgi:hypothetical protein
MNKTVFIITLLLLAGLSVSGQSKKKVIDNYFKALVSRQSKIVG